MYRICCLAKKESRVLSSRKKTAKSTKKRVRDRGGVVNTGTPDALETQDRGYSQEDRT